MTLNGLLGEGQTLTFMWVRVSQSLFLDFLKTYIIQDSILEDLMT